jgi:hypothetical protein
VASGDAEHRGPGGHIGGVDVGLRDPASRRAPGRDQADRQQLPDVAVFDQLPNEQGPGRLVSLQPDDVPNAARLGQLGQGARLTEVDPERPFREHVLAGRQRGADQPVVLGDLDRDRHGIHVGMRYQFVVVGESQRNPEDLRGGPGRGQPRGGHRGDLELIERRQRGEMGGGSPAPSRGGTDDTDPDRRPGLRSTYAHGVILPFGD